jgi:hypothetical protein
MNRETETETETGLENETRTETDTDADMETETLSIYDQQKDPEYDHRRKAGTLMDKRWTKSFEHTPGILGVSPLSMFLSYIDLTIRLWYLLRAI